MAAVICAQCNFANVHGALYCHNCYSILLDTISVNPSDMPTARRTTPIRKTLTALQLTRQNEANKLPSYAVSLYLSAAKIPLKTPVVLLLTASVIIGRSSEADDQMRLDLSRYGAAEMGVSRQHLILRRIESTLVVEDMGSTNGTWLNEVLLQPYRPATIETTSMIRLGKFSVEVYTAQ